MVDLTEFLLARIAEDEAAYRAEAAGIEWLTVNGAPMWDRLIAECEVSRRIVNAHRSGFPDEDRYALGWHDMHVWALCQMAAIYADHPDYRDEWRP